MQKRIIIIDGYNVIHRIPRWRAALRQSLEQGRERLTRFCIEWLSTRRDIEQFWLVFDGDSSVQGEGGQPARGIRVIYSGTGESADQRIVTLMEEVGRYSRFVVVSDDAFVVRSAHRLGADILSVNDFFGTLHRKRGPGHDRRATDSDAKNLLSPHDREQINRSLRREWGIEESDE